MRPPWRGACRPRPRAPPPPRSDRRRGWPLLCPRHRLVPLPHRPCSARGCFASARAAPGRRRCGAPWSIVIIPSSAAPLTPQRPPRQQQRPPRREQRPPRREQRPPRREQRPPRQQQRPPRQEQRPPKREQHPPRRAPSRRKRRRYGPPRPHGPPRSHGPPHPHGPPRSHGRRHSHRPRRAGVSSARWERRHPGGVRLCTPQILSPPRASIVSATGAYNRALANGDLCPRRSG